MYNFSSPSATRILTKPDYDICHKQHVYEMLLDHAKAWMDGMKSHNPFPVLSILTSYCLLPSYETRQHHSKQQACEKENHNKVFG